MARGRPPRYGPVVGRGRSAWALFGGLIAASAAVAATADGAQWSALVLQVEPLLWLTALVGGYLLVQARRRALAAALVFGVAGAAVLWRLPLPAFGVPAPMPPTPDWLAPVQRCAATIGVPDAEVSVLQWTVDPEMDPDVIVRTVVALSPDLTVLNRLTDSSVLDRIQAALGGDIVFQAPEARWNSIGLHTRGEFPLCGQAGVWVEGIAPGPGYLVAFVSPAVDKTFPLVVARLPEPWEGDRWASSVEATTQQMGVVLDALAAPAALLLADASSTRTYHVLDARLAANGMHPIATPPNWPIRVEGLPFLPLHPYDRAWSGVAWHARAWRVDVETGTHAPLYFKLEPARRVGAYRAP